MTLDDRCGDIGEFASTVLRVLTQHLEGPVTSESVPRHQDTFRLLDHRPTPEGSLQAVVLRETLQRYIDRALQLFRARVHDVGEHTTLGGLTDIRGIPDGEQRDHRTGRFMDDLPDQVKRVLGGEAKPNKRDIRMLLRGDRRDLPHLNLTCDHLMAEPADDLRQKLKPVTPLVRDQNTEMLD